MWSEAVNDFKGFLGINGEVNKITQTAREVGGEGFVDMIDEEVEENIEEHQKVLTNEELEDLVTSSTEEQEEIEIKPAMWTLEKFGKLFQMEQNLKEEIMFYDRMMKRSMKFTRMITERICLMN